MGTSNPQLQSDQLPSAPAAGSSSAITAQPAPAASSSLAVANTAKVNPLSAWTTVRPASMVAIQQIPVQQSAQAQLLRSQTMRAPSTTRDGKRKAVTAAEANAIIDKMLAGANGSAVDENTSAAGDSNTSLGKLVRHQQLMCRSAWSMLSGSQHAHRLCEAVWVLRWRSTQRHWGPEGQSQAVAARHAGDEQQHSRSGHEGYQTVQLQLLL